MMSSNRHEWKYQVRQKDHGNLLSMLEYLGSKDPNSSQDASYQVTSLYMDTSDLKFYRQKKLGLNPRLKFRWRWYNEDSSSLKLEIKYRYNTHISKLIKTYNQGSLNEFLRAPSSVREPLPSEFYQYLGSDHYVENLFIRYKRYAYLIDNYRVTFDVNLQCSRFSLGEEPTFFSFTNDSILELKGLGKLPDSILKILKELSLQRTSFSKYEKGLDISGII